MELLLLLLVYWKVECAPTAQAQYRIYYATAQRHYKREELTTLKSKHLKRGNGILRIRKEMNHGSKEEGIRVKNPKRNEMNIKNYNRLT